MFISHDDSPEKDPEPYETDCSKVCYHNTTDALESHPLTTVLFVLDEVDVGTYASPAPTHVFELPVSTIRSSEYHI